MNHGHSTIIVCETSFCLRDLGDVAIHCHQTLLKIYHGGLWPFDLQRIVWQCALSVPWFDLTTPATKRKMRITRITPWNKNCSNNDIVGRVVWHDQNTGKKNEERHWQHSGMDEPELFSRPWWNTTPKMRWVPPRWLSAPNGVIMSAG